MPRNVQTDHEASLTWQLKDELVRRGRVYYAKLARGKTMFVAPRLIPHFHAVWGVRRKDEPVRLGRHARAILKVLRREWEMGTADLRDESGVTDRVAFTRGIDELQAAMLVVPSEVLYSPGSPYLDARGRPVSRCAHEADAAGDCRSRDCARLPDRGRIDCARRARQGDRPVASRGRTGNRALVAEGVRRLARRRASIDWRPERAAAPPLHISR